MFQKINLKLNKIGDLSGHRGDLISSYGYIKYHKLIQTYRLFPSKYFLLAPDRFTYTEVTPKAGAPHRDLGVKTNLNIYLDPAGGTTKFYHIKPGGEPWTPDPKVFVANLFHHEDLIYYGEFTAEPFDAYLLDVSQVHEVVGLTDRNRTLIQMTWKTRSYQSVLDQIDSITV